MAAQMSASLQRLIDDMYKIGDSIEGVSQSFWDVQRKVEELELLRQQRREYIIEEEPF